MPNHCVCYGCANSCLSRHRVHGFPDRRRAAASFRSWVCFVQVKRQDFTAASITKTAVVCSAHFRDEDYVPGDLLEFRMGFWSQSRVRLIAGAVPSIHTASSPPSAAASGSGADGDGTNPTPVRDSAQRKRELCSVLEAAANDGNGSVASAVMPVDPEEEAVSSLVPQTPSVCHCGSQCNLRPLHRSAAVQVRPKMVSVGTQTGKFKKHTSTSLPSSAHSGDDLPSVFNEQPDDLSWSAEEEMMSESSDEEPSEEPLPESQPDLNAADKFIVHQSQLMSLFTSCPACFQEAQGHIEHQEGTYIKIKQVCGYERIWQNQPMLHRNMPACNLLLSGAIHFSGCMATQMLKLLKLFGLQCVSASTYFRHQRQYTIPTIVQAWQNEQAGLMRQLSGDCRLRHCAKYGTYLLLEDQINKVLDLQLVQSSEVQNSSWCELEGLKRSMEFLRKQHMAVSTLITDRNRQVAKWVWEKLCPEGTSHFFDIWHIGKSLGKALDAAAKESVCEDLKLWRPAIINHLYWTAASTPNGDPDVMAAKWQSVVNHIQDIHDHDTPVFPSCAHPPLRGRGKEQGVAGARLLLAALHFNHNGNRDVARTSDGEVCYAVSFPRFRKGGCVVHPIKEKPSYAYASALLGSLTEVYSRSPQVLRENSAILSSTAAAPLSRSCQRITKDEAVGLYKTQCSQFHTGQ